MRQVRATRYVTPLREGGSLPGIVEADDLGIYVCKFRGAGQGLRVLVAEVVVAGVARLVDVPVPDLVTVDLAPEIGRYEADEEVQDLLNASLGTNLGVDLLPGAFGYDPAHEPDRELAGRILWLDALCANVDRSWRNPNLLVWRGDLFAIDHGAALYFHHAWPGGTRSADRFAAQPYDDSEHILRHYAAEAGAQDEAAHLPDHALCPGGRARRGPGRLAGAGAGSRVARRAARALRQPPARPRVRATSLAAGNGGGGMNGYQYVALRCVPRVDREEFVNVGVVLYCHAADFLGSASLVDEERLQALDPGVDLDAVRHALAAVEQVCRGEAHVDFGVGSRATAYGDRAGRDDQSTRFGFLRAPRSTVVQPGPVHGGLTDDPAAELQRLLEALVS